MNTLLIVEDEKLIRQGIKTMVQRCGVPIDNIIECANGEAALEILRMQQVDVMFTDIRMPKMDGIALVKAMQTLPHIPLTVAVSGYDDFSYAVEMLRMGVREYILKPVDRVKVKEVLEKLNKEIDAGKESAMQDRNIGRQQLKYAILNENLTETEQELIIKQYGDYFAANGYLVICTNNTSREPVMANELPYIYLSDVNGNELYITDAKYFSILANNELTKRFVGVSALHQGMEDIREAYNEALSARKEAFYLGKTVVRYEEMISHKGTSLKLEEAVSGQIVQMLGTDKYEDAIKQLNRIFKNASLGGYEAADIERGMSRLFDEVQDTYANVLKTEKDEVKKFYEIYGYDNLAAYEADVVEWLSTFCDNLNSRFDDYKNKQKIQQAVTFIRENYDKDLNMAVVSNHISMNYSLFSYVFKQYTGSNFVNFLKEIRIEEAKRLLEETDMKIIDISGKVGYENEKHFMKTFKAACGVSPTEYRKNMQFKIKNDTVK